MTAIPTDIAYRLKYADGMFLTAETETLEQDYIVRTTALQNAMLYTPGVLSGLSVTQATGGSVAIAPGAGFDADGHFLILPGNGPVPLAVPTTSPNPSTVYLVYPGDAQQATAMASGVVNLAGIPTLVAAGTPAPANAILLAQVTLDGTGQVTGVTDARVPVASRLGSLTTTDLAADVRPVPAGATTHGTVVIPIAALPTEAAPYSGTVTFNEQGAPAFATRPGVVTQVEGPIPYPTAVGDITPLGFTLTVGSPTTTPASETPIRPVTVTWWAFA